MILIMKDIPASWIQPDWPAPPSVGSVMTSRRGGISQTPWESMNLGDHVGDHPLHVQANREQLAGLISRRPVFCQQVHGINALRLDRSTPAGLAADACWTMSADVACTIMVADCLPVLLCDGAGRWVAAAHAGWRGLAGHQGRGVLENLMSDLMQAGADVSDVLVWLGPCIGPQVFEVGADVKAAFECGPGPVDTLFEALPNGKFKADLAGLARWRLQTMGVSRIFGNNSTAKWCTVSQPDVFFSHRRDSRNLGHSGRMAACIWLGNRGVGHG